MNSKILTELGTSLNRPFGPDKVDTINPNRIFGLLAVKIPNVLCQINNIIIDHFSCSLQLGLQFKRNLLHTEILNV
jgi:hypothetical protein